MILIIGPAYSGKREYAREFITRQKSQLADGETTMIECTAPDQGEESAGVLAEVQELVTEEMDEDALEALADSLCERASVLTASETGAGIVPVGAGARRIRGNQGRLLQLLARRADSVVRVFYGIPEVIRGQV